VGPDPALVASLLLRQPLGSGKTMTDWPLLTELSVGTPFLHFVF
jgi:hypothetical protein